MKLNIQTAAHFPRTRRAAPHLYIVTRPLVSQSSSRYCRHYRYDHYQVSRLLECAAAMSAAQEQVTGRGKLDLAGVMAATCKTPMSHPWDKTDVIVWPARSAGNRLHSQE